MAKKKIATYLHEAIASGFKRIKRRFANLKEMNRNFHAQRTWIFENVKKKADYKRRLVKVLEVLKLHSCKHIGISWLTENHICDAFKEQFNESLSKRSVSTYIEHLRKLGLISTIPTKRKDGKQSANIVVMEKLGKRTGEGSVHAPVEVPEDGHPETANPMFDDAPQQDAPEADSRRQESTEVAHKDGQNLHTKITKSSVKTTDKDLKERHAKDRLGKQQQGNSKPKKSERLLNFVPRWFREKIACCATEAKSVYEYWKVAKHLTHRVFDGHIEQEDKPAVIQASIREFYQAAKAASKGKFDMQNPYGFFHAVLAAEASAHVRRQAQGSDATIYNWLEA